MKYIDADKLIAEIEKYENSAIDAYNPLGEDADFWHGKVVACEDLKTFITSLQQEPRFPQYDNIVEKVFGAGNLEGWERDEAEILVALAKEELLKSLQQEQPNKYETALEKARKWMPNVNQGGHAILIDIFPELGEGLDPRYGGRKQEQPEVDLDKQTIIDYVHNHYHYDKDFDGYGHSNLRPVFTREDLTELARHFYELGLNARK